MAMIEPACSTEDRIRFNLPTARFLSVPIHGNASLSISAETAYEMSRELNAYIAKRERAKPKEKTVA